MVTTQLGPVNYDVHIMTRAWLTSFIVLAGMIGTVTATHAAVTPTTKLNLDAATIAQGYTATHGRLQFGLTANAYPEATALIIRNKHHDRPSTPEYLQRVSPVFVYNIKMPEPKFTSQPLWLSFQYRDTKPTYQRSWYYYDTVKSDWFKLPSSVDLETGTVRAAWFAPYSLIAVFDDTRELYGPVPKDDFSEFGGINAAAAIAIDEATGKVLYSSNGDSQRSIASLTKLMTAYVALQHEPDFDQVVTYHSRFDQIGGGLHLTEGEQVTLQDYFYGMTVGSANNAAYGIVDALGYSLDDFVAEMNATAVELGLSHTTFGDPSGLAVENQSTPNDYANFLQVALDSSTMLELTTTKYYSFTTLNTGVFHDFDSTNPLLRTSSLYLTGSKTGYIDEALYCLALKAKVDDHEVITVVLGAPTSSARFSESERLMQWALASYNW